VLLVLVLVLLLLLLLLRRWKAVLEGSYNLGADIFICKGSL